jgi:hypothetical protein
VNDKIPTKITGFFITVIGTGIVLRTITTIIDRILFSNREFKISEFQNFGIIIFLISIIMGIFWVLRVRKLS